MKLETVKKAKVKLNIIKSLAGSSWGQDKETMLITYKSICRSTLEYAAPIWAPSISDTNWSRLQSVQNQALRAATGCLAMTGIDHLHQETKVLPLRTHSNMLTKQLMAAFFLPAHPGYKHLRQAKPARNLKRTLLENEEEVTELYNRGITYKEVIKTIHTRTQSEQNHKKWTYHRIKLKLEAAAVALLIS